MARRVIDIVAAGPPSADPFHPASAAWALADGFAARGHSVLVTYPGPPGKPPTPSGVGVSPFPAVTAHVGSARGEAELARWAADRLRRTSEVVVRDPSGFGSLGHLAKGRAVVSFVRSLSEDTVPAAGSVSKPSALASKLFGWADRRGDRRLEREALEEATTVCCDTAALRDRVRSDYGVPAARLRVAPRVVPQGPPPPPRDVGRRALGTPDDVLLAVVLPPPAPDAPDDGASLFEAYRRTRPIFPGVRLGVLGSSAPTGPGTIPLPSSDVAAIGTALAAADVALAHRASPGVDPGVVMAMRAGLPCVVDATADLGDNSEEVVRRAHTSDPDELASALTGLFADPAERKALGDRAREFARRFDPLYLAEQLEASGALGAD